MSEHVDTRQSLTVTVPKALLDRLGLQGLSQAIARAGGVDQSQVQVSTNSRPTGWGFSGGGVMC